MCVCETIITLFHVMTHTLKTESPMSTTVATATTTNTAQNTSNATTATATTAQSTVETDPFGSATGVTGNCTLLVFMVLTVIALLTMH